ncbi:zinc finger FYVE domain-containing protein 16 [Hyalella azteca]|uniref:Zinc finger FYVE domain-containing protein 16 n=1 Tax=Hyalella azteca TaxID=294128 RepID=A0A8B7NZQ9_HYAAZ|nr:zinc finger FYVE domain-containing protein 16 [Hyalella azteca]
MEKFAIDLDKVLDDFELDEDEQVESSQFGRLQLDYSSSASNDSSIASVPTAPATNSSYKKTTPNIPGNVLGPSGGWSQPSSSSNNFPSKNASTGLYPRNDGSSSSCGMILDFDNTDDVMEDFMIPAVRSPPDGQYDDQSSAAAHHSQYGGSHHTHTGSILPNYSSPSSLQFGAASHLSSQKNHLGSTYNPTSANNSSIVNFSVDNDNVPTNSSSSLFQNFPLSQSQSSADTGSLRQVAVGASPSDNAGQDLGSISTHLSAVSTHQNATNADGLSSSRSGINGALLGVVDEGPSFSGTNESQSHSIYGISASRRIVGDGNASVLDVTNQAGSMHRPLDVVTGTLSLPGLSSRQDVGPRHPDVIEVSQHPEEDVACNEGAFAAAFDPPQEMVNQDHPEENVAQIDDAHCPEPRILPDLMTNNGELVHHRTGDDLPEPAIIAENAVTVHSSEPALVQESQSRHGIPEVANVHQTYESAVGGIPNSSKIDETLMNVDLVHAPNSACGLRSSENCASSPSAADNTKVENSESTKMDQTLAGNSAPLVPLAFNPSANVSEIELQAELSELEEEQAMLQGAYGVNSSLNENPGKCDPSPEIQKVDSYSDGVLRHGPDIIGETVDFNEDDNAVHNDLVAVHEADNLVLDSSQEAESAVDVQENMVSHNLDQSVFDLEQRSLEPRHRMESIPSIDSEVGRKHTSCDLPPAGNLLEESCSLPENCSENSAAAEPCGLDSSPSSENTAENLPVHNEDCDVGGAAVPHGYLERQILPSANDPSQPDEDAPGEGDHSASSSPIRHTPGTLVTAVYDDVQSGRRRAREPVSESVNVVGSVAPFWVPDDDACACQECGRVFTLVRRRHHCRACGRVLCAACCRDKAQLAYMDYREARVCHTCKTLMTSTEEPDSSGTESGGAASSPTGAPHSPDPNNPMEYCSRIPPPQQAGAAGENPTVMVPVGVLKREDSSSTGRSRTSVPSKQVIFSDGIRPGGDLSELDRGTGPGSPQHPPPPHRTRTGRVARMMPGTGGGRVKGDVCLLPPDGGLPPVLLQRGKGQRQEYMSSEQSPGMEIMSASSGEYPWVQEEAGGMYTLMIQRGEPLRGVEIAIASMEVSPRRRRGNLVSELGHTILTEPDGFLGSRDHGGFLYVRPTFQCLHNLPLPQPPFLFALLIHKWEAPWAKVFPLRLLLRLGAEFRYYPCPLVSTRNRKPVFSEIGHTIMNLLVDFRNYTYTIPGIQGLVVHMEDKKTTLHIPRNRYPQISKALSNSNDHVLALAANFSPDADSHLVTIENDDGQYSTQAINIHNRPRKVTGASFVVFNGALKSNSGLTAKSSIVEDGLMVQITADVMTALREALRAMKDFSISCGVTGEQPQEQVLLHWTHDDNNCNVGVKSPIDGRAMDGVPSVKVHSGTDYVSSDFLIRWTEVFIIQGESSSCGAGDVNLSRIWEGLARGFCVALTPHLAGLHAQLNTHLALRASIHHQDVGYEAGSGGCRLSASCLKSLDAELVPVIHRAAASVTHDPIVLELFFHVLQQ